MHCYGLVLQMTKCSTSCTEALNDVVMLLEGTIVCMKNQENSHV